MAATKSLQDAKDAMSKLLAGFERAIKLHDEVEDFKSRRLTAKEQAMATLLDKLPCRKTQVPVDYAGWRIGSEFVIGYGMDDKERLRNLPYVGVVQEA